MSASESQMCQLPWPSSSSESQLPNESEGFTGVQGENSTASRESYGLAISSHAKPISNVDNSPVITITATPPHEAGLTQHTPTPPNDLSNTALETTSSCDNLSSTNSEQFSEPNHEISLASPRVTVHDSACKKQLDIHSLNCARSMATTTLAIQNMVNSDFTSILCLQELPITKTGFPPTHPDLVVFTCGKNSKVATYVKNNISYKTSTSFTFENTVIGIRVESPDITPFTVYNIYSKGGRDKSVASLTEVLRPDPSCILIGDFNCHHPWWGGSREAAKIMSANATTVVEWLEAHNFTLHNTPGVNTHFPRCNPPKLPSIIDLAFSRGDISNHVNAWVLDHETTSDHSLVGLSLLLQGFNVPSRKNNIMVRAWARTSWDTFQKIMQDKNFDLSNLTSTIDTTRAVDSVYECVQEAIDEAVPLVKFRKKWAPWWSPNLERLLTRLKRAKRRASHKREHEKSLGPRVTIHDRDRIQRDNDRLNQMQCCWERAVKNAKVAYWIKNTEGANRTTIWSSYKRHQNSHSRAIPPLEEARYFDDKCTKLREALFPCSDMHPTPLIIDCLSSRTDLSMSYEPVTIAEMNNTLRKCNKDSAVGEDGLNFMTIFKLHEAVPSLLPQLASALLLHGIHYGKWKQATCVVIPKPGKPKYNVGSAYRPISLLSCLGKVTEKIAANRIMSAALQCGAIPPTQFANREHHSACDALLRTLTLMQPGFLSQHELNRARPPRPSLATHDILGAFNNTRPDILLQIMHQRKLPQYLINWTKDFTIDRTLSFSFDGQYEARKPFRNAIPQGSPVSPALFAIMMGALTDDTMEDTLTSHTEYADDISEISVERTRNEAETALVKSFERKINQAAKIGLSFAPGKSEIIHIKAPKTRLTRKEDLNRTSPITADNRTITLAPQLKLLGVILDDRLNFNAHARQAMAKGIQSLGTLAYTRKKQWGLSPSIARHMLLGLVLPKILWASPIWWTGAPQLIHYLNIGYLRMARWITGLPMSTRTTKLLICAHLPPFEVWLDFLSRKYAISIICKPAEHGIRPLPPMESSKKDHPGPFRLLSFVSEHLEDQLEIMTPGCPLSLPTINLHQCKPKDQQQKLATIETHHQWIKTLEPNTLVIYTDGSRSQEGRTGSGWVIYKLIAQKLLQVAQGHCGLGVKTEVFNAETHAVAESMEYLHKLRDKTPRQVVLAIDNQATIKALEHNPQGTPDVFRALAQAKDLHVVGWVFKTVWIPSHCGIIGNEKADELAKRGTEDNLPTCTGAYTSQAWMMHEARTKFFHDWRKELGLQQVSWKYPIEWSRWSFKKATAFFKIYCGRTAHDTRHGKEPIYCKCKEAHISSDHILGHCMLFERSRYLALRKLPYPATLTKELILDETYGEAVRTLAESIGLGFRELLNWDLDSNAHAHSKSDPQEDTSEEVDGMLIDRETYNDLVDSWDELPFAGMI